MSNAVNYIKEKTKGKESDHKSTVTASNAWQEEREINKMCSYDFDDDCYVSIYKWNELWIFSESF